MALSIFKKKNRTHEPRDKSEITLHLTLSSSDPAQIYEKILVALMDPFTNNPGSSAAPDQNFRVMLPGGAFALHKKRSAGQEFILYPSPNERGSAYFLASTLAKALVEIHLAS
jgi:hypothetical protein